MVKKLLKPALWLLTGLGIVGPIVFFGYTLYTSRMLFQAVVPVPEEDRYFWLDNRLSIRLAVDTRRVGLFGGEADIRVRIADGADVPLRVAVSYGPVLFGGDALFGLARWRLISRHDVGRDDIGGWLDGHADFSRNISLASRVIKGRVSLPFSSGRLVLEDAQLNLSGSPSNGAFEINATAAAGRLIAPHQHLHFASALLTASALPVHWDDLGGRQRTPLSFARGEFVIDDVRVRRRDEEHQISDITGEFDAKMFEHTLSVEVFGQVGSLPVFSAEETGELAYSFLFSGVDRERLASALLRDAELSRTTPTAASYALPEAIAGYRAPVRKSLWPEDPVLQQRILALVRGGVDVYSNLKLTQEDSTAQIRFNTEFDHLGEGNSMMGLRNWGEFLDHTLADFSFIADHALAEWPLILGWVGELDRLGLITEDKFGPSSSTFIREGEIRVNGENLTVGEFLGETAEEPIPAVAALRQQRLRAVAKHRIH